VLIYSLSVRSTSTSGLVQMNPFRKLNAHGRERKQRVLEDSRRISSVIFL
jgi:hypothetical protein